MHATVYKVLLLVFICFRSYVFDLCESHVLNSLKEADKKCYSDEMYDD